MRGNVKGTTLAGGKSSANFPTFEALFQFECHGRNIRGPNGEKRVEGGGRAEEGWGSNDPLKRSLPLEQDLR